MKHFVSLVMSLTFATGHVFAQAAETRPVLNLPVIPVGPLAPADRIPPVDQLPRSMKGVEKSMLPGMSCPLVDHRPHTDILAAIQNLSRHVNPVAECQNDTDLTAVNEELKRLLGVGSSLGGYWQNPDQIATDPSKLSDFNNNLSLLVGGIDRIATTVSSNRFLGGKCGQQSLTTSGMLIALSDLVAAAAPLALLGGALVPGLSKAMPIILGITGTGSIAKVIQTMIANRTLDMSKAEHRQAMMLNVCEYSKIAQRIRFLKFAQGGQLSTLELELQATRAKLLADTEEKAVKANGTVAQLFKYWETYNGKLEAVREENRIVQSELNETLAQIKNAEDDNFTCVYTKELIQPLAADLNVADKAVLNFRNVTALQVKLTQHQSALFATEKSLRAQLLSIPSEQLVAQGATCAKLAGSYLTTLRKISLSTTTTVEALKDSLMSQLKKNSGFATLWKQQESTQAELNQMLKVTSVLKDVQQESASIDKSEIHIHLSDLKRGLFGKQPGFFAGASPARAWLEFMDGQFQFTRDLFEKDMSALVSDSFKMTRSGQNDGYVRDEKGEIKKNWLGYPVKMSISELGEAYRRDFEIAKKLENLTAANAPVGTLQHKQTCLKLETALLNWSASKDHLGSMKFFCSSISSLLDREVEAKISSYCEDSVDFAGKVTTRSLIGDMMAQLTEQVAMGKAKTVQAKFEELQCPRPTVSAL